MSYNKNLALLQNRVNKNLMTLHYNKSIKKKLYKKQYISIIVPVMGRIQFLIPLINAMKEAIKNCDKKISITIVEHSYDQLFKETSRSLDVDYYWIPKKEDEPFNKSLCHNIGAILNRNSEHFLFHDLDCLVLTNFFNDLIKLIDEKHEFIQTFKERRLLYLNEELTQYIIDDALPSDFDAGNKITYGTCCAPGGSILITNELFFKIGGYDPELFHGYSPEDQFFLEKAEFYTELKSASNELYHMHHTSLETTNSDIEDMLNYVNNFNELNEPEKLLFLNYKKDILKKFI